MTRKMLMAGALVAALAIPVMAHQQGRADGPGRGGRGGPGGPNLIGAAMRLDLSDAQRDQLKAIADEDRKNGPGAGLREAEQKLHAAVLADTQDVAAIEGLKATLNAAHSAELDHRIAVMQKIAQVLTPAQRQQLLTLRPEGRGGRH